MEKKIYLIIAGLLFLAFIVSMFTSKRDKVLAKLKDYMILARIWLHTEEGEAKKKWVLEKIIEWISTTGKFPITTKILLYIFNEAFLSKMIDKIAPDVKDTFKPAIKNTLNKVGEVAVENLAKSIIDLGTSNSGDINVSNLNTKDVVDLANTLKFKDEDKGVISAIASYKTDFKDEHELVGSIGYVKKI